MSERRKLSDERDSRTHKFAVAGFEMYVTVGLYEDGTPGELFIHGAGKEGSTTRGLLDAFALMFSLALQYGADLDDLIDKLAFRRFEPLGMALGIREIKEATSIMDYLARWLAHNWGSDEMKERLRVEEAELHAIAG